MTIRVHHLRIGRSLFTVWLLEELGLDYELEIYERTELGRAPESLKAAHPLGKSPVLELDGITMAESTAIQLYLVETRDSGGLFTPPASGPERARFLQWLHYPEGSAFLPLLLQLLLTRESAPKPPVVSAFAAAETSLHLGFIRDGLGDSPFILGDRLQLPDFGLAYIAAMADRLGLLGEFPSVKAYAERAMARPAFRRATERTGG